MLSLEECQAQLEAGKYLDEASFRSVCSIVIDALAEEANVIDVPLPAKVCGDVHGQFYDVLELFRVAGKVPESRYVFMGDYVDRGHYGLETIQYLLVLKARWPDRIFLIRGNHESRKVTQQYGFYDECIKKYGHTGGWNLCMEVFDYLSIAAVIGGKVYCVHGGLSPDAPTLELVQALDRYGDLPRAGCYADMVWSDPEDIAGWAISPRGAGYLYGPSVVNEFCRLNDLDLILRAHQLAQEGYTFHFPNCATVWSCPNYCYRCGNKASVLELDEHLNRNFIMFDQVPEPETTEKDLAVQYFV